MDTLSGSLDSASAVGVTGWVANLSLPDEFLQIEVFIDGQLVTTQRADQPRPDLWSALGQSTSHGFVVRFQNLPSERSRVELDVRVANSVWRFPGSPILIDLSPVLTPTRFYDKPSQSGHYIHAIELYGNNIITGWVAFAPDLNRRCIVVVRARGIDLLKAVCEDYRSDLSDIGIGDGRYGFTIEVPDVLLQERDTTVYVNELYSGYCLTPDGFILKFPSVSSFGWLSNVDRVLASTGLPRYAADVLAHQTCVNLTAPPIERSISENCLALICTRNYLPYARQTARSFAQFHPEFTISLLLVDGTIDDAPLFPYGDIFTVCELGFTGWEWFSAKFSASEFANALKPVFLKRLSGHFRKIVYLDCDIVVFDRLSELLDELEAHAFVLIPHMLTPVPKPEQYWVRPNRGDTFNAGLLNGGCFGLKPLECLEFLNQWEEMNFAVGSFLSDAGFQTDQQNLNWVVVSTEDFSVLREYRYNVAYWNLHERDLRVEQSGSSYDFTVSNKPLGFFHFSGFDIHDPFRTSQHDGRNSVYDLPATAELLKLYSEWILNDDVSYLLNAPYGFDVLPNGLRLDKFLREIIKRYEVYIPRFDVRTICGANGLSLFLMAPLPAVRSMLPLIAALILDARPDLQSSCATSHTSACPSEFWRWFNRHASLEYGPSVKFLIDRHRKFVITNELRGFCEDALSVADLSNLQFLGKDRTVAADRLAQRGREDLAEILMCSDRERFVCNDLASVFAMYEIRSDLQVIFPDILGEDREAFRNWLSAHGSEEHNLSAAAAEAFSNTDAARSLCVIFSYVARTEHLWELARNHFLVDNIDPFLRALLAAAGEGLEFDINDVIVLRYVHEKQRAKLVALYLEFPFVRKITHANRILYRNLEMLPVEIRGEAWARAGASSHAATFDQVLAFIDDEFRHWGSLALNPGGDVVGILRGAKKTDNLVRSIEPLVTRAMTKARSAGIQPVGFEKLLTERRSIPGVNVYGYFQSDIGVGESSRGLADAVAVLRPVNRLPFYTAQMSECVQLRDLFQQYDYLTDTNVFVSFPHQREDLISRMRPEQVTGRKNIAHLAWEQKDANPWWKVVYERYDEIWTISNFAAVPFERMFPGRVRVVANVLDFDSFPIDHRSASRCLEDTTKFLYIFDAGSSIERKNPEAVIEAFARAFAGTTFKNRVSLTLKIGSMYRPDYFFRVNELQQKAGRTGLSISFEGRNMSREETLRFIASHDCYVSLHRSEGFGYTMAEAMAYGLPVVATGYSGNLDFMSEDDSFLVPASEVFVRNPDGPFQRGSIWGEPDIDAAAEYLRFVVSNPYEAASIGQKGKMRVREQLNPISVSALLAKTFN